MLVAPAGFGKTTLARQWARRNRAMWLSAGLASSDIAAFARALADALCARVPTAPRRVEEALRAAPTPLLQSQAVSRAILREIGDQLGAWLVIDDYHHVATGSPVDSLVATLEESGRLHLFVTSRTRPKWASHRRLLYGDIIELRQDQLAFSDSECLELFSDSKTATSLLQQARGWPALVALAAAAGSPHSPPFDTRPALLYDFFADELYARCSIASREALLRIALLPALPAAALQELCDEDALESAIGTGLVHEVSGVIDIHPLVRRFLYSKIRGRAELRGSVADGVLFALANGYWDDAFSLISEFSLHEYLEDLVTDSFLPLLDTGRLATLDAFGVYGAKVGGVSQGLLDLIDAEVSLREGLFGRAHSLGVIAASSLPPGHRLKARSYVIAGSAARLDWKPAAAFGLFTEAIASSQRVRDTNDASWGACLTALFLEDERMEQVVGDFAALQDGRAEDRLHVLMARQHLARLSAGLYDLSRDAATAEHLVPAIPDPLVRTGWGNTYGYSLMLQANYRDARTALNTALEDVKRHELTFARPHLEWSLAATYLGLRRLAPADRTLRRVELHAETADDHYLQLNCRALRARLLLTQNRIDEAIAATGSDLVAPQANAMYGEYLATPGLALALADRAEEALATAAKALTATRAVETQVYVSATRAVIAMAGPNAEAAAADLISTASRLGTWDPVVCAIRASPPLLHQLAASAGHTADLVRILIGSNDLALARSAGLIRHRPRRGGLLSPREIEVLDLVAQGSRTAQIAAILYISEATVKMHMRHIFASLTHGRELRQSRTTRSGHSRDDLDHRASTTAASSAASSSMPLT